MELEIEPCSKVKAPMLKKAPVSLECKVKSVTSFETHDMFLAEIVNVNIDDQLLEEDGRLALEKAGLLTFVHGRYYTLGRDLGAFGFSVDKTKENKTKPRKSKFLEVLKLEKQVKSATDKLRQPRKAGSETERRRPRHDEEGYKPRRKPRDENGESSYQRPNRDGDSYKPRRSSSESSRRDGFAPRSPKARDFSSEQHRSDKKTRPATRDGKPFRTSRKKEDKA